MLAEVTDAQIIYHQWDQMHGIREIARAFVSLDDLFAFCLDVADPKMVDRIIINGHDGDGQVRAVTFTFQSMTVSPGTDG
ncbi:MAG: hypothetical protein JXB47_13735 [Anaerolineae bacterium]|nr:hypothetical protein [Anaerolineae bacterium]